MRKGKEEEEEEEAKVIYEVGEVRELHADF